MKTIEINGTAIGVSHVVKTDEQTNHTAIHVTVAAEDLQSTHSLAIGAIDEPLPLDYDASALQKDVDAFRLKSAAMLESKLRAKKLAKGIV
jgi:hypothetical protein